MGILIWFALLLFWAVLLWDSRPVNPTHPGLERIKADIDHRGKPPADAK